ncbi:MAG: DUSP domain-containing protein, partial [Planctomycetota bacterium]
GLATPHSEAAAVRNALARASVRPGEAAFVLAKDWWVAWCKYANVTALEESPRALGLLLTEKDLQTKSPRKKDEADEEPPMNPVLHAAALGEQRPDEIDNSGLLTQNDGEIKAELALAKDFVLVPRDVWDCFTTWYGGGPALPRTAVDADVFDLRPLSLRVAACDRNGDLPFFARKSAGVCKRSSQRMMELSTPFTSIWKRAR